MFRCIAAGTQALFSLVLVCCFAWAPAGAQQVTTSYLDRLAKEHQACLDSGLRMMDCATDYYATMDSLLNVVYRQLRAGLNPAHKDALKKEQLAWLRRRDALGAQVLRENKRDGIYGSDGYMIVYDRQADFIGARIRELLKR